jgi:DNA-binding NtrC family response regulator
MASESAQAPTVLVLLNSEEEIPFFSDIARRCGARLKMGRTLTDVLTHLERDPADVVLTPSHLSESKDNWKDVLYAMERKGAIRPLIVTSRLADEFLWAEVLNLGGFDVLAKPFDTTEVERVIGCALRERVRIMARRPESHRRRSAGKHPASVQASATA